MCAIRIYAFADESSKYFDGQMDALLRNRLQGIEVRNIEKVSISDYTPVQAKEIRQRLDDNGLCCWSIGSPMGKMDPEKETFAQHLDRFKNTIEIAYILGADKIRTFSFHVPKDSTHEAFRGEALDMMGKLVEANAGSGLTLCLENEKGVYGDTALHCLDILRNYPTIRQVFDPANFVQVGQETLSAWNLLQPYVKYMHIKDAIGARVVPAGAGDGHVNEIAHMYYAAGGRDFTIEPHLSKFIGLSELEKGGGGETIIDSLAYPTREAAFDAAVTAFRGLWK